MKWFRVLLAPFLWLLSREAGLFEVVSGFAAVGWGILACQNFPADDRPPSVDVLIMLGIQKPVAAFAITVGLGQAFAFGLIDQEWTRPWLRWFGAASGVALWSMLAMSSVVLTEWPIAPGSVWLWGGLAGNMLLLPRIMQRTSHGER